MPPKGESRRIAIIGAGPIGLEAALYASRLGFPVAVYERGDTAEYLTRWGHVRLFTPFGMNTTTLGLDTIRKEHPQHQLPAPTDLLTGHDFRDAYLLPLTLSSMLCDHICLKSEVVRIGRAGLLKTDPVHDPRRLTAPFRLLVRDDKQAERMEEADIVLDCSGTYGMPRWIGESGVPAIGEMAASRQVAYGLEDILGGRKAHYAGKSVLVVGGGYSAATTVSLLSSLAEQNSATWTIWLARGPRSTPLPRNPSDPLRERDRLAARVNALATRGEGNVEYYAQTVIDAIEAHPGDRGFRVSGRVAGKPMVWEVERVIGNVGYQPDMNLFRELHVPEPIGLGPVRQPEPNFFLLGAKALGRDSGFLMRQGHDRIREVFALLTGKASLDLYSGKS